MKQNVNQKTSGVKGATTQEIYDYVYRHMGLMNARVNCVTYDYEGKTYVRLETDAILGSDLRNLENNGMKVVFIDIDITRRFLICVEIL